MTGQRKKNDKKKNTSKRKQQHTESDDESIVPVGVRTRNQRQQPVGPPGNMDILDLLGFSLVKMTDTYLGGSVTRLLQETHIPMSKYEEFCMVFNNVRAGVTIRQPNFKK